MTTEPKVDMADVVLSVCNWPDEVINELKNACDISIDNIINKCATRQTQIDIAVKNIADVSTDLLNDWQNEIAREKVRLNLVIETKAVLVSALQIKELGLNR